MGRKQREPATMNVTPEERFGIEQAFGLIMDMWREKWDKTTKANTFVLTDEAWKDLQQAIFETGTSMVDAVKTDQRKES